MNKMPKQQTGFSLIELLIAAALGLLIIAGLLHLFIASKQSYRMQTAASNLHNNARFALDFMGQHIRLAGFYGLKNNQTTDFMDVFAADSASGFTHAGQIINGEDDDESTSNSNEEHISLRYRGADTWYGASPILDCYGNSVSAENIVTLSFRLNDDKALICAVAGSVPRYQPLVQDVEDLEIWYGVDIDYDGSVNTYLSASSIKDSPNLSWRQVKAVRILLSFSSGNNHLHRVFTTTFYLRNPII